MNFMSKYVIFCWNRDSKPEFMVCDVDESLWRPCGVVARMMDLEGKI